MKPNSIWFEEQEVKECANEVASLYKQIREALRYQLHEERVHDVAMVILKEMLRTCR